MFSMSVGLFCVKSLVADSDLIENLPRPMATGCKSSHIFFITVLLEADSSVNRSLEDVHFVNEP
jgi:hypothetical protein